MGPTMPRTTRMLTLPLFLGRNEFAFQTALKAAICLACFETYSMFSFCSDDTWTACLAVQNVEYSIY